jgi:hypothetical protein
MILSYFASSPTDPPHIRDGPADDDSVETVQERRLIERTRQLYPWFLPGEIRPAEDPPDYSLHREGERIALQVTRLFIRKGMRRSRDAKPSRSTARSCVARRSLARSAGLPVLDVLVYFGHRER